MKIILAILAQLIILAKFSDGAKILLISPIGTKSHLNGFKGMLQQLTERGHQMTIISAYPSSKKMNNVRDVVIPVNMTSIGLVKNVFTGGSEGLMLNLLMNVPYRCSETLAIDAVQALKHEKFDVIILSSFFSDCYLSLVHHFQAPLIYIAPTAFISAFSQQAGRIYFISLEGNILLEGTQPYGFFYRLKATLVDTALNSFVYYYTISKMESICRAKGLCPEDMPSFDEMKAATSLAVANSVKFLHSTPTPDLPNIIYGGGSHCEKAKPLPKELEKWVQESGDDGFIFFSLGSAVTPSDMPEGTRVIFRNVFGKLKQRVLWKWDTDMDDLPSNVRLGKWLPQQDLLGHPKMKLFISHGGLHSIMETAYHGVRFLGMPIFADQYGNIQEGVQDGWAESLHWKDLTEELLLKKIKSVLNNKGMNKIIARRSKIMTDRPRHPKEEVAYWVEYVLRNDDATHLRSPVYNMPFYILYNIDVWLTIVGFMFVMSIAFFWMMKSLIKRLFRKIKTSNEKKKKQ